MSKIELWLQFTTLEHGRDFAKNKLDNKKWTKESGRKSIPIEPKREVVIVFTDFDSEDEARKFEAYIKRDLDPTHIKECRITYGERFEIGFYVDIDKIAKNGQSWGGGYDEGYDLYYDVVAEGPLTFFGKQTKIYPDGMCTVSSNEKRGSEAYNKELERFKTVLEPYRSRNL